MRTQGLGPLAPQPVGPSGQLGKEQTLSGAEDLFSRYGVGLGQSDSAPSRRNALSRCWTVWIHSWTGRWHHLKRFQRLLGHMAACGGGNAAGATPYETASTLAPWPSPEVVGVAERHAAGPSHSSLPPNLHPVVRPFIPSGRSAPGTGLQARCGLHRCLRQGLGGPRSTGMQCRGFGRSPTALHINCLELLAVHLALNHLKRRLRGEHVLVRTDSTATIAYINRQGGLRSCCMSQLARHPPPLESEASEVASRHSYPGLAQTDSRRAVTSCAPRRVETPSPDGPADLATFWTRTGRPAQVDLHR